MSDRIESMLDRLGAGCGTSEPAPAFLRAVARRRHRRRLLQIGSAAAVLLAAAGAWLLVQGSNRAVKPDRRIIHAEQPAPGLIQASSLASLTRANIDRDTSDLDLPEPSGSGEPSPVRLGLRLDSVRLEQWLSQ